MGSTRHLLEALETTAATCGPKERALLVVTMRNFDREVVLRGVVSGGLPTGLLQVANEEGNLTLACVEGKLAVPAPF